MLDLYRPAPAALLLLLLLPIVMTLSSCSSSRRTAGDHDGRVERGSDPDEREAEEEQEEAREHGRPVPPMEWGSGIHVEPIEGPERSAGFHLGSPLLLRLVIDGPRGCAPFDGRPFYFEESGAQLGWGFEEISDSVLFPSKPGRCERIVLLSSDHSNRLAEGVYTFKVLVQFEDGAKMFSDTITLNAVRSASGADSVSYARFLQEQIVRHSPLLADPETITALFAEGTPRSAESEVYHALVLQRAGDPNGAKSALAAAVQLAAQRKRPLARPASDAADALTRVIQQPSSRR